MKDDYSGGHLHHHKRDDLHVNGWNSSPKCVMPGTRIITATASMLPGLWAVLPGAVAYYPRPYCHRVRYQHVFLSSRWECGTWSAWWYEAGSIVASYEYGPFGETIKATGPQASSNAFRYSGHYFDIETGNLQWEETILFTDAWSISVTGPQRGTRSSPCLQLLLQLYSYFYYLRLGRAHLSSIYEGVTLTYEPATGAMDIQESPDLGFG